MERSSSVVVVSRGESGSRVKDTGGGEYIKLKVVAEDGVEVHFKIKPSTQMSKLMKGFCDYCKIQQSGLRFLVDGGRVHRRQTPAELDLKNNDVIEVRSIQDGGGR